MSRGVCLTVCVTSLVLAVVASGQAIPTATVTGFSGPNRWMSAGDSSEKKPATIGDATGRMQVPVANGDVVAFAVSSGTHHVLFENAKSETANGVWEVVKDTGTLEKLPDNKFPHYNHDETRFSTAGTGKLIQIRVLKLAKGKSILFGCNPHSESKDNKKDVPMLGAIVLK